MECKKCQPWFTIYRMTKRIIAIDCDDVIVATAPAIIAHYNKVYGTHLQLKDLYSENLALWGVDSRRAAIQRVEAYIKTDEYQRILPFQDAVEVIKDLSWQHELHIVTGRGDFLATATEAMLAQHFPDMFRSIEFTHFFGHAARSKAEVCKELGG